MTPKLNFIYSLPLDALLYRTVENKYDEKNQPKSAKKYLEKLQKSWNKINNIVFNEIQEASNIGWKKKKFYCFIVNKSIMSISWPMITSVKKDAKRAKAVLIHELAHYNLDSSRKNQVALRLLKKKFKNENPIVIRHVILDLLLIQVLPRLFGKKYFEEIVEKDKQSDLPFYRSAWEIAFEINKANKKSIWGKIKKYCLKKPDLKSA